MIISGASNAGISYRPVRIHPIVELHPLCIKRASLLHADMQMSNKTDATYTVVFQLINLSVSKASLRGLLDTKLNLDIEARGREGIIYR